MSSSDAGFSVTTSAPGKVILFGEHSVVYDKPAVAAAINLRTTVTASLSPSSEEGILSVDLPDISVSRTWDIPTLTSFMATHGDALGLPPSLSPPPVTQEIMDAIASSLCNPDDHAAMTAFLFVVLPLLFPSPAPDAPSSSSHITFHAVSELPIGAGLGSSAAFSVALASAALRIAPAASSLAWVADQDSGEDSKEEDEHTLRVVNEWAFAAETVIHGTPSGIDNTVATYGKAVRYQSKVSSPVSLPELSLVLVDTRVPRSTKALVAGVRSKRDALPGVMDPVLDAMGALADAAVDVLQDGGSYAPLSTLIETNQALLAAIGVSHPALAAVVAIANTEGPFPAKLTGAGGGGCAIILLPPDVPDSSVDSLSAALSASPFHESDLPRVFRTSIGARGVSISSKAPLSTNQ